MRKWVQVVGVFLLLVIGYFGVGLTQDILQKRAYAESDKLATNVNQEPVTINTKFALNIFNKLCEEDVDQNVFISPLSISTALTMAYTGAEGSTESAMENTLGYSDMSTDQVKEYYRSLFSSLENVDKDVTLNNANSVWVKDSFESQVKEDYIVTLKDYFTSELHVSPFNQETVTQMNKWVSQKTADKIKKIIETIDRDNVMFLVNAIYFKADWTNPFKEKETMERDFTLIDGSTVSVDTMHQKMDFKHVEGEGFAAARFPYGREQVAMYIFLPSPEASLDTFLTGLTQEKLDEAIDQMHIESDLDVRIPKFKLEYGVKRINDVLIELGMGIAFDSVNANFSDIADVEPENLFIAFVDHVAVIEVDEKGTEAAAATNVGVSLTSMPPPSNHFYVDRPFFFIIRDDRTNTILFMGKITNPLIETTN